MFSFSDRSSAKEPGVLHGQTDSRVPNTGAIVMCKLILLCLYFFLFLYINLLQVAGIKTAISLKEKVCKIMNKTYGRCFRSLDQFYKFNLLGRSLFDSLPSIG